MLQRKSYISVVTLGLTCAVVLGLMVPATAGIVVLGPDVQIEVGVVGNTQILNPLASPTEVANQFSTNGLMSHAMWDLDWSMTVDTDPFINGVFGLTNNTAATQTFVLNVSLPIAPPVTPSSLIGGSVGGSVTDANNSGAATVATIAGVPFYNGLIDGVGALPIYPDPFSVSAPFSGGTANILALNPGLPGPTIPGPAALTSIGINHTFTLTAGDTIALTSFFVVVPEPASLGLLACGALLIGLKRRD